MSADATDPESAAASAANSAARSSAATAVHGSRLAFVTCASPLSLPAADDYVKINVGGCLFHAALRTVTRRDGLLRAMFSGHLEVFTDSEGWILIDRCGKHFGTLLSYLRDGSVALPHSRRALQEILTEARHYLLQGLVEESQLALQQTKHHYEPICKIPVITSSKEEQQLITASQKPVVKLLYNRSNNKYSYTSMSDDNTLKNIELFDKLSLRFNGRVLFIKDVIGDEICCWSFYGLGRKIAEVCCTSIVYTTEKKQTKVEFPEARIYEETLNILLYEARDGRHGPDNALLEATGGAAGRPNAPDAADDDEEQQQQLEQQQQQQQLEQQQQQQQQQRRVGRVRRIHVKRLDERSHHQQQ